MAHILAIKMQASKGEEIVSLLSFDEDQFMLQNNL